MGYGVKRCRRITRLHASPAQPEEWDYLVSAEDGFAAFAHFRSAKWTWLFQNAAVIVIPEQLRI